ncbi:MAG: hypothetical protein ABSG25_07915 [Bryobacteraceae bacterium]
MRRFGAQPLAHLLAEVVDVILGHQNLDPVHEFLTGPRILGEDDVLFDEVNFDVEFIDSEPVLDVPVQPVGLLDKQDPAFRVPTQQAKHGGECKPSSAFRGLRVEEFLLDGQALLRGVGPEEFLLRSNAIALFLLFRGNPRVQDCGLFGSLHHE